MDGKQGDQPSFRRLDDLNVVGSMKKEGGYHGVLGHEGLDEGSRLGEAVLIGALPRECE